MVQKIALEEHFLSPEYIKPWLPTVAEMPAAKRDYLLGALTDFGERRLAAMDKAGIKRPRRAGRTRHRQGDPRRQSVE
jgi:2,3-dihydroxybenzoate decarboxylase